MKKKIFFTILAIGTFVIMSPAKAICPVCTVAVIGGVGLSRWLGIDDTITGLWIGGVTISLIIWTIDWLNKKNIRFWFRKILIIVLYYGFIVVPLVWWDVVNYPTNTLWGMDKLLFGTIIGTIAFLAGVIAFPYTKNKATGKSYFPYQKVVMAISPLIIFSLIFFFLIK
ncbi:MAG: hypothetical protein WCV92_01615 [Candidatus Buchananbacteria bacterium]